MRNLRQINQKRMNASMGVSPSVAVKRATEDGRRVAKPLKVEGVRRVNGGMSKRIHRPGGKYSKVRFVGSLIG